MPAAIGSCVDLPNVAAAADGGNHFVANAIASRISYAKNCLVTPGAYAANATYAAEDRRLQIPEFGTIYNLSLIHI